jgi:broad specificity phosphatase PhoE
MQNPSGRRTAKAAATALTACALFAGATLPAAAMTLTFVRHAESQGNASGKIDTKVPGPELTTETDNANGGEYGTAQAEAVAQVLADRELASGKEYDGIYWSKMTRTAQTAAPTVALLGEDGGELPGVHELAAGIFEGQEERGILSIGFILAPLAWIAGAQLIGTPGAELGVGLDGRMDDSIQQIADNGDENAIVFSHGGTIMFWTLMNVQNPDIGLMLSHSLDNTDIVVVEGSAEEGWVLKEWGGKAVAAEPNLPTKLFVDVRDVVVAPQTAVYRISQALQTGDPEKIAEAIRTGATNVVEKTVGFPGEVVKDVVESLDNKPFTAVSPADDAAEATTKVADDAADVTVGDQVATPAERAHAALADRAAEVADLAKGTAVKREKALSEVRQKIRDAAQEANAGAEASAKKVAESVRKLTRAGKADTGGRTANADNPGSESANTGTSASSNAA